jgi:hypothetical protein
VHIGTTTVENLLRVARRDSAAGTAFAAFDAGGRACEIISVPEPGSAEGFTADELAELVHQASADPEFVHARVFVRRARVGREVTLVVAPLRGGGGHSMMGLVAEPERRFEAAHLDLLGQLAERLVRHIRVVQQLARPGDLGGERLGVGSNGGDERPGRLRSADAVPEAPQGVPEARPSVPEAPEFPPFVGADVPAGAAPVPATRDAVVGPSPRGGGPPPRTRAPSDQSADGPMSDDTAAAFLTRPVPGAAWWAQRDQLSGLLGLVRFSSRAGRLLAPGERSAGTFVLVLVEVPDVRTVQPAASALAAALRSTDPVGRIDERVLAAALLLADESSDAVERRIAAAVRSALERPAGVRTAHAVAAPGDARDIDELLREALARLDDR